MAVRHTGNMQPALDFEEHEGLLNAKRVAPIGGAGLTSLPTIYAVVNTSAAGQASIVLDNSLAKIGFATVAISTPTLFAVVNTAAAGQASIVLDVGTKFIGLVTAVTRNAGTIKTLIPLSIGLGNNSLLTVAVPTNANKINITNLLLNSNATTGLAIKSGVTYLIGNASLAVTLLPGGGFVLPGNVDAPSWIGLPSGALVVEKRDSGGTVANVAGQVIYFDE